MEETARAELAVMQAGRDVCDYTFGIAAGVTTPQAPGTRIREWRRVRVLALTGLDRAVLLELLSGTTWEQVAEALMLPLDETIRRYGPVLTQWTSGAGPDPDVLRGTDLTVGLPVDTDPEGTAAALDQWLRRHREPWDDPGPTLASRFTS